MISNKENEDINRTASRGLSGNVKNDFHFNKQQQQQNKSCYRNSKLNNHNHQNSKYRKNNSRDSIFDDRRTNVQYNRSYTGRDSTTKCTRHTNKGSEQHNLCPHYKLFLERSDFDISREHYLHIEAIRRETNVDVNIKRQLTSLANSIAVEYSSGN